MKIFSLFIVSLFGCMSLFAQEKGFVIKGRIPGMPDGVEVSLLAAEKDLLGGESSTLVETTVKNGYFELRGKLDAPLLCTLITNNQMLHLKDTSCQIKWTYTPLFVENVEIAIKADDYDSVTSETPFIVEGGEAQRDYAEYQRLKEERRRGESAEWEFILSHPRSVVSVMFANQMLLRGYNLTGEQVKTLEKSILSVPTDTARFALFQERIAHAKLTVIGAPLMNLEMNDLDGKLINLVDVVHEGKFMLVDFWASWCGMCIHAMPKVKALQDEFKDRFNAISDDNALYPLIPKYDEKHELFIIISGNEVDSNWLRERLDMQHMKSYKTGKISKSNVIDIKDVRHALQNSNSKP